MIHPRRPAASRTRARRAFRRRRTLRETLVQDPLTVTERRALSEMEREDNEVTRRVWARLQEAIRLHIRGQTARRQEVINGMARREVIPPPPTIEEHQRHAAVQAGPPGARDAGTQTDPVFVMTQEEEDHLLE